MNVHWRGIGAGSIFEELGLLLILKRGAALLLACACTQTASASRSGLNNVPNADTSTPDSGVFQLYSAFGEDRDTSALAGVRYGFSLFDQKFEAGVDGRWQADDTAAFLNAKWALPRRAGIPNFALGIANLAPVAEHRSIIGQPQSYGVLSQPFGAAAVHVGYALQRNNNALFVGVDYKWSVLSKPVVFRADAIQIQNQSQWLVSAGLTCRFTKVIGLELWQSIPTERGKTYTTVKLGL